MATHIGYTEMLNDIDSLKRAIQNIDSILSENFTVTSLRGSTVGSLESAIANFKNSLQQIKEPINTMMTSIEAVRADYAAREQKLQSALSGSSNATGKALNNQSINMVK